MGRNGYGMGMEWVWNGYGMGMEWVWNGMGPVQEGQQQPSGPSSQSDIRLGGACPIVIIAFIVPQQHLARSIPSRLLLICEGHAGC